MNYNQKIEEILLQIKNSKEKSSATGKEYLLEIIKSGDLYVLSNINLIALELARPLELIESFIKKQISLPIIKIEYKSKEVPCFKNLNPSQKKILNKALVDFIDKYVKCKRCANLYTTLQNEVITCKACGFSANV